MIISITSLRLTSPLKIPKLIKYSSGVMRQINEAGCLGVRTFGIWRNHYTMTKWDSHEAMRQFASSGAHREATKQSSNLATEVNVFTIEAQEFPSWKEAKALLSDQGKKYSFKKRP